MTGRDVARIAPRAERDSRDIPKKAKTPPSQSIDLTTPVPRQMLRGLWVVLAWSMVFLLATTAMGVLREDYDSLQQAISALSLGEHGWMQRVNLVLFGLVLTGSAWLWRRILLRGVGETWFPILTMVSGISFALLGLIPPDPSPGYDPAFLELDGPTARGLWHVAIAAVAAVCSVASVLVMAVRFAADWKWNAWALYTRGVAVLMIMCMALNGIWSTVSFGFAGAFERMAIVLPTVWAFIFVRQLWLGAPFMTGSGAKSIS